MNKVETLEALELAKKLHIEQMEKIVSLIAGKKIENPTPVAKTECEFGKIFYGQKDDFFRTLGAQFYEKLDTLHEQWHLDYIKINNIFFKNKKEGIFSKIIGSDKVNPLEYDKAKMYYVELKQVTNELLKLLDASIRRVSASSPSKFKH